MHHHLPNVMMHGLTLRSRSKMRAGQGSSCVFAAKRVGDSLSAQGLRRPFPSTAKASHPT